jgi:hypothetical protein
MKLSKEIESIFDQNDQISLRQILEKIQTKSFGILLTILSLPSAIPIPLPGYSTPLGLALIYLSISIIKNKDYPKLPDFILNKKIKGGNKSTAVKFMVGFLKFFEKFLKPRKSHFYHKLWFKRLLGILVLLSAICMISPVPLTNNLPALAIFIIGLGMLEEDFYFGILGIITSFIGMIFVISVHVLVAIFGFAVIDNIRDFVLQLFY